MLRLVRHEKSLDILLNDYLKKCYQTKIIDLTQYVAIGFIHLNQKVKGKVAFVILKSTQLIKSLGEKTDAKSFKYIKRNPIPIDCCENKEVLENWLGNVDITATDFLKDTTRFTPTSKISTQGTRIYQEIESNYYWHFDNFHDYISFEVYDKQGTHIGVANIDGEIDFDQAVEGRSISNIL